MRFLIHGLTSPPSHAAAHWQLVEVEDDGSDTEGEEVGTDTFVCIQVPDGLVLFVSR